MRFILATSAVFLALPLFAQDVEPLEVQPAVDPVTVSTKLVQLDLRSHSEESVDETLTTLEDLIEEVLELITDRYVDEDVIDSETLSVGAIRGIVAARLVRALDALSDRAVAGGWSRETTRMVATEFLQRSETFVDAPDPMDFRNRVIGALERSSMMATTTSQMLAILRREILMDRLALLRFELQAMLNTGEISFQQYSESYQRQVLRARLVYIEWTYV